MSDLSSSVIGVAGCGAMGRPIAERLLDAGFHVRGFDVRPLSEFGTFARHMIADATEFAAVSDCLISVVRDRRQTMDLCFDVQAVMAPAAPSKTPSLITHPDHMGLIVE